MVYTIALIVLIFLCALLTRKRILVKTMSTSNRTGGNKDRQTACGDIEKNAMF